MKLLKSIIFACLYSMHLSVWAQVTYEGCNDIRNMPVASISDYSVQDIAVAMLAPNGTPQIRYNQNVLVSVAPQTRVFFYMHECGHHALGHNFGTTHPLRMEQDADCFAIQTMVKNRMVNASDIRVIQADLYSRARGDWSHLPGPMRAINLGRCLADNPRSSRTRIQPKGAEPENEDHDDLDESKARVTERSKVSEPSTPHSYVRPTYDDPPQEQSEPIVEGPSIKSVNSSELSSCTAKLRCEIDTLEQICACRTTIAAIAEENGFSENKKMKLTGEKCYSGQYDIHTCWTDPNVNLARASCTTMLEDANKAIPAPKPGSCLDKNKRK
ncbi:hypothetical protein [Massilia glaciei]|uniref:hypothetical protein n=1 Tax=Massilia glaciei TaxID=1524097 RepID=UPI0011B1CCFD|nr:hypothetical protein [Massilia glaciei]